jgi:hypothetical protein
LLDFLATAGRTPRSLTDRFPPHRHVRHESEPHLWTAAEIRRVLAVIDRWSVTGKRDYTKSKKGSCVNSPTTAGRRAITRLAPHRGAAYVTSQRPSPRFCPPASGYPLSHACFGIAG